VSYLSTTQDSLPVAGQALLDGVFTRKVPMKGFKVVIYISFPFPKLLGAIDATDARRMTELPRLLKASFGPLTFCGVADRRDLA
jgi:hypothetical protein